MASNIDKFRGLLRELFQLDQADLDFGIYRIMNQKRDEVVRFLDQDLLPQVQQAFAKYKSNDKTTLQTELTKLATTLSDAGMNPDDSPKVNALKQQIAESSVDVAGLENEVFSHLFNFFRRYYEEGDFISLRRYKEGVYAIPYEGEEVKLHWANADQYYVKSSEYFRDYAFVVGPNRRVHFRLAEADTEKDNNRAAAGSERRFQFIEGPNAVIEVNGELIIRFEYKTDSQKRRQSALNDAAEQRILESAPDNWHFALNALRIASSIDPKPSILRHHLSQYTARNTFDYFIHKNLGGFLCRELDFYIKNEVMHLDDVLPTEQGTTAEQQAVLTAAQSKMASRLSVIAILRDIGRKIIRFLAQIEDFQKKLWLKKKFVISTDWLITVDRVPVSLRDVIARNDRSWVEWEALGLRDNETSLVSPPWGTRAYLDANDKLVVDTKFFREQPDFLAKLLASDSILGGKSSLHEATTGVLVHSENFQALQLMQELYREEVKCVYIDPPYNTGSSAILYKNDYKHSTWCTLMLDRLSQLRSTLTADGAIFVSVDKTERTILEHAMEIVFTPANKVEELIWAMNTNNSQAPNYSTNHEYILVYARDKMIVEGNRRMFREPKPGYEEVSVLIDKLNGDFPPISEVEAAIKKLYADHKMEYRDQLAAQGLDYEFEKGADPWKGLFNYSQAEYRNGTGQYVPELTARTEKNAKLWVWREADSSMPAAKQAESTRDPAHRNYRFYRPAHPLTGKPCPHPKSGWKFAYDDDEDSPDRRSFVSLDRDRRIVWGADETKVPQLKRMLHEVETNVAKSVFQDYSDGEKQTSALFGRSGIFLAPKHTSFVRRFIHHATTRSGVVLDCFGGSGSTAHAVIEANRDDAGERKFVLAEMGAHFESVLKPRVVKVMYSPTWKDGRATSHGKGASGLVKVLRLEGYEDTLNNLRFTRTTEQSNLLSQFDAVAEEYTLGYMMEAESRNSMSLLNIEAFSNPFAYTLDVTTGSAGETKPVTVDLVETFNWLLGLRVKHIDHVRRVRVVDGTNPQGERVLILWRNTAETDSEKLNAWFEKQGYSTLDMEYAVVYVNGDNNLENLRRADQTWKVRLIEEEFQRLMFDVQDV